MSGKYTFKTAQQVVSIPFATSGSGTYWTDEAHRHLKLHAQRSKKTWRFVKRVDGQSYDEKLGDSPALTLLEARRKADNMLFAIQHGEHRSRADGPRYNDLKLSDGWAILQERTKNERSLKAYRSTWKNHLQHFGNRNMVKLATDHGALRAWHERTKAHSLHVAQLALALLASIYKHTRKIHPQMPKLDMVTLDRDAPPTGKYDLSPTALAQHHAAVARCRTPVRRDFMDFLYFTGSRVRAASLLQWEMVEDDRIRFPASVMKVPREFVLPLTPELVPIVARQRDNGSPFVFPGRSLQDPISATYPPGAWSQRALRSHFASVAHSTVPYVHAELLMAHALPGLTQTYVQPSFAELAEAMAKVTMELMERKTNGEKHER